jgi:hypothetical protein
LTTDRAEATEIGPAAAHDRRMRAFKIRLNAAISQGFQKPAPDHPANPYEEFLPGRIGSFHKALPHNGYGEVAPAPTKPS